MKLIDISAYYLFASGVWINYDKIIKFLWIWTGGGLKDWNNEHNSSTQWCASKAGLLLCKWGWCTMQYDARKFVILREIKVLGSTGRWQNHSSEELMVWSIHHMIRSTLLYIGRPAISVEHVLMSFCYSKILSSPCNSGVRHWSGREKISMECLTAVEVCCTSVLLNFIIQLCLNLPGNGCNMHSFMALSIFPTGSSNTASRNIGKDIKKWARLFRYKKNETVEERGAVFIRKWIYRD